MVGLITTAITIVALAGLATFFGVRSFQKDEKERAAKEEK